MKKQVLILLIAIATMPLMSESPKIENSQSTPQENEQETLSLTGEEFDSLIGDAYDAGVVAARKSAFEEINASLKREKLYKNIALITGGACAGLLIYEGVRLLVNSLKQ